MRLFNDLRAHFALMTGRELKTLSRGTRFKILSVLPPKGSKTTWIVNLGVGRRGNTAQIYVTDILRCYLFVVSENWGHWVNMKQFSSFVSMNCVNARCASYIMALMTTFDDIEARPGTKAAIRFILPEE